MAQLKLFSVDQSQPVEAGSQIATPEGIGQRSSEWMSFIEAIEWCLVDSVFLIGTIPVRRQKGAGKLHVGRWTSSAAALMPEQLRRDALAPGSHPWK